MKKLNYILKTTFHYFSKPIRLALLNTFLIVLAIYFNTQIQAFCIPTDWACIVSIICFINLITTPFLNNHWLINMNSFINGFTFSICIYCVMFFEELNFMGLIFIFIGIGLLIYIPHFFIFQLIYHHLIKPKNKLSKTLFLLSFIISIGIAISSSIHYKTCCKNIVESLRNNQTLKNSYMTEKIVGMHFKYHTRICIYDGWRPPIHDPLLNISLMLNQYHDPLIHLTLSQRIYLYKKQFPNNPIKLECSCAHEESSTYHHDSIWLKN